jgi:signal transduction histidine kinase
MANPKALLLHDDPRTVALAGSVLASEGFDVVEADSPYRLLEVPVESAPDLLVLGVAGFDHDDLALVGVLRRRWPDTTLLVVFPAALRDHAARCLDLGADGYLPEPFYPGELSALARRAVDRPVPRRAADTATAGPTPKPGGAVRPADESLSKLAAGAAHSIRNPLQILELQLGSYEADAQLDVPGMREQLARIAAVAEGLSRFSGRRKLNTRLVDVNALVQRVFTDGPPRARPVRVALAADRLEVLGAPDLLRAALEAVHDRAQRVTPEGGEIAVTTTLVEAGGERFAEIVVTDDGPVPSPERLAQIFDPFPDADHVVEGTGMEMAAAAGILRNHGGNAGVSTEAGAGASATTPAKTSIVLRLPARGRTAPGGPPAEART